MRFFRIIIVALFLHCSTFLLFADESEEAKASSVLQNALPDEFASIFPIGRTFFGVAIPSYENEKLQSVMRAETITRIDERFLDLTELVITIYSGGEEGQTQIFMKEAGYDLVSGTLRSKTPARIEQEKFTMTGKTMTFDTQSQVSHLVGDVKVVIPDASLLGPTMGLPTPTSQ